MVTKRDDNRRPTIDRVNIEQSASGRWTGRVLQYSRHSEIVFSPSENIWGWLKKFCLVKRFLTEWKCFRPTQRCWGTTGSWRSRLECGRWVSFLPQHILNMSHLEYHTLNMSYVGGCLCLRWDLFLKVRGARLLKEMVKPENETEVDPLNDMWTALNWFLID